MCTRRSKSSSCSFTDHVNIINSDTYLTYFCLARNNPWNVVVVVFFYLTFCRSVLSFLIYFFIMSISSSELDLPYPDLQEYIADMNMMMALIINGPV